MSGDVERSSVVVAIVLQLAAALTAPRCHLFVAECETTPRWVSALSSRLCLVNPPTSHRGLHPVICWQEGGAFAYTCPGVRGQVLQRD